MNRQLTFYFEILLILQPVYRETKDVELVYNVCTTGAFVIHFDTLTAGVANADCERCLEHPRPCSSQAGDAVCYGVVQVGLATTFLAGVLQLMLAPLAHIITSRLPRVALLSGLAGIGIVYLALQFSSEVALRLRVHLEVWMPACAVVQVSKTQFPRSSALAGIPISAVRDLSLRCPDALLCVEVSKSARSPTGPTPCEHAPVSAHWHDGMMLRCAASSLR